MALGFDGPGFVGPGTVVPVLTVPILTGNPTLDLNGEPTELFIPPSWWGPRLGHSGCHSHIFCFSSPAMFNNR